MTDDDGQATGWEFEAFKKDYLARKCSLTLLTPVPSPEPPHKQPVDACMNISQLRTESTRPRQREDTGTNARGVESLPDNSSTSTGHVHVFWREAKNTPAPKKRLPCLPRWTADDDEALEQAFQRAEAPKEQPPRRLQATTAIQQRLQEAPLDDFVQNRLRDEEAPGRIPTTNRQYTRQEHFEGMLTMKKMTGDGNCIFHALAEKSGENAVHLRSQIIQYLKENAASQEHEEQVEAWLEEAEHLESNPSNWGGDTAVVAFTLMRQQQAFVHWRASDGEIRTSERTHVEVREEARRRPHAVPNVYYHAIHLWYNGKDHYDVLVPIDQT
ncbi:OTUD4, partial [Symbiodinium sp. CCMP2592]